MTSVLDSCVALKSVLPENDSKRAESILDEYRAQLIDLIALDIFPIEIAHALAKAERRKLIPSSLSSSKLADVLQSLPTLHLSYPLLVRAFDIASSFKIGVYDCLYVAL